MTLSLKQWPLHERPREKFCQLGASALSDAELIAILFGTGCNGQDVLTWSRQILHQSGGLSALLTMNEQQLKGIHGIGPARAIQLQVILELAKRYLATTLARGEGFTRPQLVRDYLAAQLRHQTREVFAVLLLDSQHRLLHYAELFFGTINAAPVYPREIVKVVMQHNAAAVIIAHNHPSGVAEPSIADQRVTERIQDALKVIDVALLDHFVIGAEGTVSFAERGML
ncbi:DNA replication and repair protein RadC [Aliidiomarina maris]|uniref:DNA replication and repair protein RadC n=1 Tax=Aliidiomarina maris TaxID=531312 RepID=A0A327X1M8_9GAMM|nr:DNA replication and repair protein RadC [Aliidiomarina maris]